MLNAWMTSIGTRLLPDRPASRVISSTLHSASAAQRALAALRAALDEVERGSGSHGAGMSTSEANIASRRGDVGCAESAGEGGARVESSVLALATVCGGRKGS
jgi:hypothetical protein